MTQWREAGYRWSAWAALISCATAFAQQPEQGVSFEADSVSVRSGSSVFAGLTVTDGAISIDAAEGTTTSQGDDGVWDLRGGLRISIDVAILTADSGSLQFAAGTFTQVELLGEPVTLDALAGSGSRPFHLIAGRISFDGAQRVFTASQGAIFSSNGMEIRNCRWTYDLADKSVQGLAEPDTKCNANVVVNRTPVQ